MQSWLSRLQHPSMLRLLALLCAFLLASAAIATKAALQECPPFFLMGIRFLIAGGVLCAASWCAGLTWPKDGTEWLQLVLVGLANNAGYLGLTAWSIRYLSGGTAAVMASTNGILLALGAAVFLHEALTRRTLAGFALALLGIVVIMSARMGGADHPLGVVLALVGNCINVAGALLFKKWARHCSLLVNHGVQLATGGAALTLLALVTEDPHAIVFNPHFMVALGYLVLVVSCVAMLIWFFLLRYGTTTLAGSYMFLVPVFGFLQGAYFLGEPLRLLDGVGSVLVACGVFVAGKTVTRPNPKVS